MNAFSERSSSTAPFLKNEEIHLWKCLFSSKGNHISDLYGLLSQSEKQQAARFIYKKLRDRYCFYHGVLRIILGMYTHAPPDELIYIKNTFGKPQLSEKNNPGKIQFNFSDSDDIGLVAVVRNRPIGLDVEKVKKIVDARNIIHREFSPEEQHDLMSLSDAEITEPFFMCWTQKEAYIKAIGKGLSYPLNRFSVPIRNFNSVQKKQGIRIGHAEMGEWRVDLLRPHEGYVGAVITKRTALELRLFDFEYCRDAS